MTITDILLGSAGRQAWSRLFGRARPLKPVRPRLAVQVARGGSSGGGDGLSVSALLFDYVLTGPISAVSAGQYIAGLGNDLLVRAGAAVQLPVDPVSVAIALAILAYFWWRNTQGVRESSRDALGIVGITTLMVVVLLGWAALTLLWHGGAVPPAPVARNLRFSGEALGWLRGTAWPTITAIALLVGLGHSFLAMSGEESLAQVYREIEHPKVQNLRRTGLVIFLYSLVFTSVVSFLAVALIPDSARPRFYDNLISGVAMHLAGPLSLRLLFQAFVVIVGFLILAGAANTAIIGSNAVLNRVSEDGVLTEWFRKPIPASARPIGSSTRSSSCRSGRSFSAAATSTCSARRMRLGWSGALPSRRWPCSSSVSASPASASGAFP